MSRQRFYRRETTAHDTIEEYQQRVRDSVDTTMGNTNSSNKISAQDRYASPSPPRIHHPTPPQLSHHPAQSWT